MDTKLIPRLRSGSMASEVRTLTKAQIRSKILDELKIQKEEDRNRKSRVIKKKLFSLRVFKKARVVMFYIALKDEVNTQEMIKEARKLGKIVTVPVCKKNIKMIRPAILDSYAKTKKGPYGISEPVRERRVRLEDLGLVVVPGLAFDRKGNRLGRGKGYYDRFLNTLPGDTPIIGLAFDFQILPCIPVLAHDISVKKLLFA